MPRTWSLWNFANCMRLNEALLSSIEYERKTAFFKQNLLEMVVVT